MTRRSGAGSSPPVPKPRKAERKLRRLRLLRDKPQEVQRRQFVLQGVALTAAGCGLTYGALGTTSTSAGSDVRVPVRPPSALAIDADFQAACTRCGMCGVVCENGCIRFFGANEIGHGAMTPYLDVRRRSCTLCMRCTQICPTGALSPIEDSLPTIIENVRMGTAVVDPENCLSYQGRICGYCHDACPIPEASIKLTPPALPVVLDGCVGCGRCVEECPQTPTAIHIERFPA